MILRYLKLGGRQVSVIGLGAWQIGTKSWGWGTELGPKDVVSFLEAASEAGINLIDTAELYGKGESERQIGLALKRAINSFVIASKVSPWNLRGQSVYNAASGSLERLGIRHIDLYQLHAANPFIPIKGTMKGIKRLLAEGKIGYAGVSNFSLNRWQRAEKALGTTIVSNQMEYNLLRPNNYHHMKPMLDENHLMIAYSPLGMGLLTGKYDCINKPFGSRQSSPEFTSGNYANVRRVIEVIRKIAKSHSATISQISLAWVVARDRVIAIPGAKSIAQVKENAEAADIHLTAIEINQLDEVSQAYKQSFHVPRPFEIYKWLFTRG